MEYAIRVNNLCKSYGGRAVIKGLTFDVYKGEIFALLGVNGAGKTTSLECIEGLRGYDSGSILIDGKTGIQFQNASLPSDIRPCEAVRLFSKFKKSTEECRAMLSKFGIDTPRKVKYSQMSTGQKRRLHLALALMEDPDIVFLDEPSAGLDAEGRVLLHGLIRSLKARGKTIILSSHDMTEVESLCDRIAVIHEKHAVFCGTAEELAGIAGRQYEIRITTAHGGDSFTTDDIGRFLPRLLKSLEEKNEDILDVKIDRGSLEQHFIKLTKGGAK